MLSAPFSSFGALPGMTPQATDPLGIAESYAAVCAAWMHHPESAAAYWMQAQQTWLHQMATAWDRTMLNPGDREGTPASDPRFSDPGWAQNPAAQALLTHYMHMAHAIENWIQQAPELDTRQRERALFWAKQMIDAWSPTHFVSTNPAAIRRAWETGGQSLIQGWQYFIEDCQKGQVSMVDPAPFVVGKTLATTPGQVVFRNALMELIQYQPMTETVHQIPLLFVPPWINKFYILDLDQKKSMVRHLLQQGFTVFLISWKNPTPDMRHTGLGDYVIEGILRATEVIQQITQVPQMHAIGYCIGGTALSATMAYIHQHKAYKKNRPISSWTLLCSLQDFSNPGEIGVFINEPTIAYIEQLMAPTGYLSGSYMALTFRLLRANSLIWEYAVRQYLMGEKPAAFDILYWNSDSTRLPEKMHQEYLRGLYLENRLVNPGAFAVGSIGIDLGTITAPLYAVGTEQDHITPWQETFKVHRYMASPIRYVLAASGHIVGVLSPPVNPPKRHYWVSDLPTSTALEPSDWLAHTPQTTGSWWEDWVPWLAEHTGPRVAPPPMGNAQWPALCPAPGTYVTEP